MMDAMHELHGDVSTPVLYEARPVPFVRAAFLAFAGVMFILLVALLVFSVMVPRPGVQLAVTLAPTAVVGIVLPTACTRLRFTVTGQGITSRGIVLTRTATWPEIARIRSGGWLVKLGGVVVERHDGTSFYSRITTAHWGLLRGEPWDSFTGEAPAEPVRAAIAAHQQWLAAQHYPQQAAGNAPQRD